MANQVKEQNKKAVSQKKQTKKACTVSKVQPKQEKAQKPVIKQVGTKKPLELEFRSVPEVKTPENLIFLYPEKLREDKNFIGSGFLGFKPSLLDKKTTEGLEKLDLTSKILEKYNSCLPDKKFKSLNDIVKQMPHIKGVNYRANYTMKTTKYSKMKVTGIVKLSKFVAIDSSVRKIFKNHSFIYYNHLYCPVLIVNNDTNEVEGYIMPNTKYWTDNNGDLKFPEIEIVKH